jgi:hypothetical protein
MALASIAVPPDAKRDARAAELVESVGSWPKHTLKVAWGAFEAGTVFRRAPGSHGERYLVNAVACQCRDYQAAGQICKHIRAVVAWEARQVELAKSADSASFAASARPTYEDLFPPCKGGCGDVADTKDGFCDRCASDREWRARLAARREQGAEIARHQIAAGLTFADVINPLAE